MKRVVAKFGGTSVKDALAMRRSGKIVLEHMPMVVVLSATAKTTDALSHIANLAFKNNLEGAQANINEINLRHKKLANEFGGNECTLREINLLIHKLETLVFGVSYLNELTNRALDSILSIGERLSSLIFIDCLRNLSKETRFAFLDARKIIKTNNDYNRAKPLPNEIKKACDTLITDPSTCYVTQGFIGSTVDGVTTTLGRGGSDSSAALIAEGINADLLQIWTDVAGVATVDPKICQNAKSITEITYDEAAEMAQYGAKVLHPATIQPAVRAGIEIFVGSSLNHDTSGTVIRKTTSDKPVLRAITKRSNQSLLIVRTPTMLNAFGFLSEIFSVFHKHSISVDCVTTSEISVAISVDKSTLANTQLLNDLKSYGQVSIEEGLALISIIGNKLRHTEGVGLLIFDALQDVNVKMICLGASEHNFCVLVEENQVKTAINKLHQHFVR